VGQHGQQESGVQRRKYIDALIGPMTVNTAQRHARRFPRPRTGSSRLEDDLVKTLKRWKRASEQADINLADISQKLEDREHRIQCLPETAGRDREAETAGDVIIEFIVIAGLKPGATPTHLMCAGFQPTLHNPQTTEMTDDKAVFGMIGLGTMDLSTTEHGRTRLQCGRMRHQHEQVATLEKEGEGSPVRGFSLPDMIQSLGNRPALMLLVPAGKSRRQRYQRTDSVAGQGRHHHRRKFALH
jgi:hypothetical protein